MTPEQRDQIIHLLQKGDFHLRFLRANRIGNCFGHHFKLCCFQKFFCVFSFFFNSER